MPVDQHRNGEADATPSSSPPISVERVTKTAARLPSARTAALKDVSLTVRSGEMVAVLGAHGSGTSTLLDLCGGLTRPDTGTVRICGRTVSGLSKPSAAALRRRTVGYVLQDYNLMPTLTLLENAALPLELDGVNAAEARDRALLALAAVGLAGLGSQMPDQVTPAQRQRAAVARASAGTRRVLLADEPTAALDSETAAEVLGLLAQLAAAGLAVLVATHDPDVAKAATRTVHLVDGELRAS